MSATHSARSLIELASARLWHDIGPLVCSLDRAAAGRGDLREAAHALLASLRLRQAAWTPPPHAPLALGHLTALARGLPDRAGLDTAPLDPGTVFAPEAGRIVLNLLLLGADSLPGGGVILLAGSADDLFIRITGPAAALAGRPGALPRGRGSGAVGPDGADRDADGLDRPAGPGFRHPAVGADVAAPGGRAADAAAGG